MDDIDRVVETLRQRVDALEVEAAHRRQPTAQQSTAPSLGSRRQVLLGGAGLLGAMAGGALLGRAEPASAASSETVTARPASDKHLSLCVTLTPLRTRGVLWADHDWDFGAHFVGEQPPVVVATAFDDYMEHYVAAFCVCAVVVRGAPGAYRATIMVRNISTYATEVVINAVALGV